MGAYFTVIIYMCVCFCPPLLHYSVNDFDIHLPYPAEHVFNNYFPVVHDIISRFSRERFFSPAITLIFNVLCVEQRKRDNDRRFITYIILYSYLVYLHRWWYIINSFRVIFILYTAKYNVNRIYIRQVKLTSLYFMRNKYVYDETNLI